MQKFKWESRGNLRSPWKPLSVTNHRKTTSILESFGSSHEVRAETISRICPLFILPQASAYVHWWKGDTKMYGPL